MKSIEPRVDDVIVVDENFRDYDRLANELDLQAVRLSMFATGESALRVAGAYSSALWIVNVRLPDMSGISFLTLVRNRLERTSIFLVGDAYSAEDELAARAAGATAYVCKPANIDWLSGQRRRCRTPAIRAGPNVRTKHSPVDAVEHR